jgi:hypothetical protein
VGRRELVLGAAVALGALPAVAAAADNERRPKAGDLLVHSMGPKKGKPLSVEDLPPGGPGLLALPMDPATGTVLDGSRFNEVVAVRLDAADTSGFAQCHFTATTAAGPSAPPRGGGHGSDCVDGLAATPPLQLGGQRSGRDRTRHHALAFLRSSKRAVWSSSSANRSGGWLSY